MPAVAGKSTLSRLEHAPEEGVAFAPPRYHKISHDAGAIEALFVTLFLEAHGRPPKRIILDLDAIDDFAARASSMPTLAIARITSLRDA